MAAKKRSSPSAPRVALIIETSLGSGRRILQGVTRYAWERGPWSFYLEPRSLEAEIPRWLRSWHGDGIIARIHTRSLAEEVLSIGVPVVDTLGTEAELGIPLVHVDDAAVARVAAEHFIERGLQHFACCSLSQPNWSRRRSDAFVRTIAAWKLDCALHHVAEYVDSDASWEQQQEELAAWIAGLPKPVGVFAVNDIVGMRVLEATRRVRVKAPDEVAVVGVDNDETVCQVCNPPLSSVVAEHGRVGYEAARLLDILMHEKMPPIDRLFIPPKEVVIRASSDVVALADPQVAAALRVIREEACDRIGVGGVAARVGMSRTTLKRRFQSMFKRSVHDEICAAQMKRVQQLLTETDMPLKIVAKRAGFRHVSYMSAAFKSRIGVTPGEYRRQSQRG